MVAVRSTPAARSTPHSPSRGGLLTQLSPSELSAAVRKFSWLAADVVAHGVGLSQASCNQPAYFFLEAPTFARGLQFRAQLRGPSVLAATIRDRGDGSYEAKYTCAVSGDYALHVTLGLFTWGAWSAGCSAIGALQDDYASWRWSERAVAVSPW